MKFTQFLLLFAVNTMTIALPVFAATYLGVRFGFKCARRHAQATIKPQRKDHDDD